MALQSRLGGYVARCQRESSFASSVPPSSNEIHSDSTTFGQDIISYVWSNLVLLIPQSLQHEKTSQQFFEIALVVLRAIDSSGGKGLDLPTYIQDWSGLLLQHKHDEVCQRSHSAPVIADSCKFVGRDSIDWVIHGISTLLNWCIQLAKPLKKPLNFG